MGSFRVGIGFEECPKCDNKNCIVDVWDRDYEGIKKDYYCPTCNVDSTNLFLRNYIEGKLRSRIYHLHNSVDIGSEDKIAKSIFEILTYDDNNLQSNDLFKKMKGIREFKLEEVFSFDKVRKSVLTSLIEYGKQKI